MKIKFLPARFFLIFIFFSIIISTSCRKEENLMAETAINGIDGSTILSGEGAPSPTLGKIGDYYLDKKEALLYGPKNGTGWGIAALNLRGEKGDQGISGTNGSQMFSGMGSPALTVGVLGDFYFDKQNIIIFGPKTNTGWGEGISLKPANADGVKVLLVKNHVFQNVSRSAEYDNINQASLMANDAEKVALENQMTTSQADYNQQLAYYNELKANNQITQQSYDSSIAQITQALNAAKAYYEQ